MTFQQLKYFQAVVAYKSFSKAAESCFVAQTAVSKQIANLENELGCTLLIRDKQHVSLTKYGVIFSEYTTEILRLCDAAIRDTKMAKLMTPFHLKIGYWGIMEQRMLTDLVRKFKMTYKTEGFMPVYTSVNLEDVIPDLLKRKQDIILMPIVIVKGNPRISHMTLMKSNICLAVGKDHPLAGRKEVFTDELRTENFIETDTSGSKSLNEFRESWWKELGFHPNIIFRSAETESALLMTETGGGVMLVTELLQSYMPNRFSYVKIHDFHVCQEMGLAWLSENTAPQLKQFLEFSQKQNICVV